MTPDDIDDVVARLKLQRFWPHLPDLDEDCADAVAAIEQLQRQLEVAQIMFKRSNEFHEIDMEIARAKWQGGVA